MSSPIIPEGHRLFARYAHAPNALGYCGPAAAATLQAVACGRDPSDAAARRAIAAEADASSEGAQILDVASIARRFSGAWPYQQLIARLVEAQQGSPAGSLDPLSVEVGRAYWTGHALTAQIDAQAFGRALLAHVTAQAGRYWSHLTPDLLEEATPTHAFHVLGVYPWSRLLATGLPEPLHVLDSCRIRVGRVLAIEESEELDTEREGSAGARSTRRLLVDVDTLSWDGRALGITPTRPESVEWTTPDGTFTGPVRPGDLVAVHWGFACDVLTAAEADILLAGTQAQVEATNRRLLRS